MTVWNKETAPCISVIVPIYNRERYLSECIESVLQQSYENVELLLVDDGSTDGSLGICERYAEEDARVVVIHQENQGRVVARNTGLVQATGGLVYFLDSDDFIDLDTLERMYLLMIEKDVDMVGFSIEMFGEGDFCEFPNFQGEYTTNPEDSQCIFNYFPKSIQEECLITLCLTTKLFHRMQILSPLLSSPKQIRIGEDACQMLCIFPHLKKMYFQNDCTYHYRQHTENTMLTLEKLCLLEFYESFQYVSTQYENHVFLEVALFYVRYKFLGMTLHYLNKNLKNSFPIYHLDDSCFHEGYKVVIYGIGKCGKHYYEDLQKWTNHQVVGLVDKKLAGTKFQGMDILPPSALEQLTYDKILIAVYAEAQAEEIKTEITKNYSIQDKKICWKKPRNFLDYLL